MELVQVILVVALAVFNAIDVTDPGTPVDEVTQHGRWIGRVISTHQGCKRNIQLMTAITECMQVIRKAAAKTQYGIRQRGRI